MGLCFELDADGYKGGSFIRLVFNYIWCAIGCKSLLVIFFSSIFIDMTYGYSWGVGATKRGLMNLAGGTMPR